jgi:hypothetical protein
MNQAGGVIFATALAFFLFKSHKKSSVWWEQNFR